MSTDATCVGISGAGSFSCSREQEENAIHRLVSCLFSMLVPPACLQRRENYSRILQFRKNSAEKPYRFKRDSDDACKIEGVSSELMLIQRTRLDLKLLRHELGSCYSL